jgi:hypothetical protein
MWQVEYMPFGTKGSSAPSPLSQPINLKIVAFLTKAYISPYSEKSESSCYRSSTRDNLFVLYHPGGAEALLKEIIIFCLLNKGKTSRRTR